MRIVAARIAPFRLPVVAPLPGGVRVRDGFVLRLESDAGLRGLGEASPSFWVGGEDRGAARSSLERIVEAVGGGPSTEDLAGLAPDLVPSARSALETSLLDLEARARGVPLAVLLGGETAPLEIAALVPGESAAAVAEAAGVRIRQGFRSFKLKVGGRSLEEDVERVAALRRSAGPSASIRLDANRAWTLRQARRALERFARFDIALVEEPLGAPDLAELERLRRETRVPIALDESVCDADDLERVVETRALDVLVIKAARMGGPRAALGLARRARARGLGVFVTDSIETSIGRSLALHLAGALPAPRAPVGLGGAMLLAGDVVGKGGIGATPTSRPAGPGLGVELADERQGATPDA